jgi:hypothetical protein
LALKKFTISVSRFGLAKARAPASEAASAAAASCERTL